MNRIAKVFAAAAGLLGVSVAIAEQHAIDSRASVITVQVYKSGVFSAFAHDHQIAASIASGNVDTASRRVELRVKAGALRVLDTKGSDKDHNEIQKAMLGPDVLDVDVYPEIVFRSTAADSLGSNAWRVRGELTLHGKPVSVIAQVSERAGHYVGHALLNQTDFGIKPVRIAGGAVRVKNEVRIEFDIQLAH